MIKVTAHLYLHLSDIKITFICSPGPGGQNVNKLATAAQLRFNIPASSFPEDVRMHLVEKLANKITPDGDIVIKASRFRTQERNKHDAIDRLIELLKIALIIPRKRKKTKPTRASSERRLNKKKLHGQTKSQRGFKASRDEG